MHPSVPLPSDPWLLVVVDQPAGMSEIAKSFVWRWELVVPPAALVWAVPSFVAPLGAGAMPIAALNMSMDTRT